MDFKEVQNFIKGEFKGFSKKEAVFFFLVILTVVFLSFYLNDSKIALLSAICGISYTILAGKGKVICYLIGITGTFCYCYLSYKNGFFGNLLLYGLYYLPMEITGIFKWLRHYKKEACEIYKTKLKKKERVIYFGITTVLAVLTVYFLFLNNGKNPIMDGVTTVFSILGQMLTLKRCVEQWYVWTFVNLISLVMWITAYINGSNCLVTAIMWGVYSVLGVYFLIQWKKEID